LLAARYGIKTEGIDGVSVIEGVAVRRGFRLKGGDLDLEKAAHTLLQDYRTGALGRISLETPQTRAALLARHQEEIARRQAEAEAEEESDGQDDTR
jgi:ribosome biogenesis GTPase A